MRFVFYTNSVSPHQLPLAKELVSFLGENEYRYVFTAPMTTERMKMGWGDARYPWLVSEQENKAEARRILENAECLMCAVRDMDLMERRARKGLVTIFNSERWFKPRGGFLRLLKPAYFKMARRFARLLRTSESTYYFPMGIHAARDMARLCGLMNGDLRCLFRSPRLHFERKPGGRIDLAATSAKSEKKYCLDKMSMWGYFVETSNLELQTSNSKLPTVRILWVGRFLWWKRVDTIVRAVVECAKLNCADDSSPRILLDIYGTGLEETRLKKMASGYEHAIKFHSPVPIADVRKLMRDHDVYVLASNGCEGWGAAVSEALEEDMKVFGTRESGSSATILPDETLFSSGDWRGLKRMLLQFAEGRAVGGKMKKQGIGAWSARNAALALKEWMDA